jgi:putative transcriptional regulator
MNQSEDYHKGKILIADPFLLGPVFERSVIFLADHSEVGAMGFILNQPTDFEVEKAIPELKGCKQKMYYGGPVDESLLFYVHSLGKSLPKSIEIEKGIYWGGEFDILCDLNAQGKLNPGNIKFFIGYSGWKENQLEGEFEKNSWIVSPCKNTYLFKDQSKTLWNTTINESGDDSSFLGEFAHTPSMN